MNLFSNSIELKNTINEITQNVAHELPNVYFEEYIVLCKLNNFIILRFSNSDIESLTLENITNRILKIRDIVGDDFLINFIGRDYKVLGLDFDKFEETLRNCNNSIDNQQFNKYPSYYLNIEEDKQKINRLASNKLDYWEFQIEGNSIEVLFFTESQNKINSIDSISFYPITFNSTYEGIIKALLNSISSKKSMLQVLLDNQK